MSEPNIFLIIFKDFKGKKQRLHYKKKCRSVGRAICPSFGINLSFKLEHFQIHVKNQTGC